MDQSGDFIRAASVAATGNWALLIDGENVGAENADAILSPHSDAFSIRRVYGEISVLQDKHWTDVPELRAIHASRGRNSADILLVVEAMCLAQSGVRNFVIVSGDGGMIHLIRHLREVGCRVVVMAPKMNCSAALRTAGHNFIELETAPAPVVPKKPTLDAFVLDVVTSAGSEGITTVELNVRVLRELGMKISEQTQKTWSAYLTHSDRKGRYTCVKSGSVVWVHLASTP